MRLTPARSYNPEVLDDPDTDPALVVRSVREISRSNTLFGGARAALAELAGMMDTLPRQATLLDVGTGVGDIPDKARRLAKRRGIELSTLGLDSETVLLRAAEQRVTQVVCGDATSLPFADRSVDVVMCSQVLHHFRGNEAMMLVREMNRVARRVVLIADLRRSWLAAGGFWVASYPLHFHWITRHDGVVSVMRGFTSVELADTVENALGFRPRVRRRLGFRLTTSWRPV